MKIGIYGGTFDPPHLGHMAAAKAALAALDLDRLLLVPAAQPPHKSLPPEGASAEERLEMTRLMADGIALEMGRRAVVTADDIELRRSGKSYTADTVAALSARYPNAELWLLLGSDMFRSFHLWREPQRIAGLAGIAAFSREKGDEDAMHAQASFLRETLGATVKPIPLAETIELSSTGLRARLKQGPGAALRGDLWCQVYGYILSHGLYGVNCDLTRLSDDDLRSVSLSMVKAKRIPHICGTEGESVRLAERWGADPGLARRAGILHDCTKYLNLDEQLTLCDKYGITLDNLERSAVKLLHAKTGAALADHVFGAPREIVDAIYAHTTGKADMTTLQKILYLADYIEPSREDFPGLTQLRKLAYEDLDRAMLLGCALTIADMNDRGVPVHHNTLEARAFLRGRME